MRECRLTNIKVVLVLALLLVVCSGGCGSESPTGEVAGGAPDESLPEEPHISPIVNIRENPEAMNVGDLMWVNFDVNGNFSLSFANIPSESVFRLILQSGESESYFKIYPFTIENIDETVNNSKIVDNSDASELDVPHLDHLPCVLGKEEAMNMPTPSFHQQKSFKGNVVNQVAVGDHGMFTIYTGIKPLDEAVVIGAEAQCVIGGVAIYVDDRMKNETPDNLLPPSLMESLCISFNRILEQESGWFGPPPDINGDGAVAVLLTPVVNQMTVVDGLSSLSIKGFFKAHDLYPQSSSNPYSNAREIFYFAVPDSTGNYGGSITNPSYALNELSSTFAHELQHLMSYYLHVIVMGGMPENHGMDEGLSILVSDLIGYEDALNNVASYFSDFNPLMSSVVGSAYTPSSEFAQRIRTYLMLRYLYEQHVASVDFLHDLVVSKLRGVENLENAFNGTDANFDDIGEFLMRSGIAIALTDMKVTSDPRFVYQPRQFSDSTGQWHGICAVCQSETGRNLNGLSSVDIFQGSIQKKIRNTGQWFIDFVNSKSATALPTKLSLSAPPEAIPQGALIRIH